MHHEAIRVSRTIDDLLELSRIEAGEASLREPVPVHLVLAEAVERSLERRRTARHHPRPRASRHAGSSVLGDRRQLVSAVFNLLDNAIKYSAPGSSVVVSAATDGPRVHLSVADRGIGIPRRDLERIFERFYRVDRARSRDTGAPASVWPSSATSRRTTAARSASTPARARAHVHARVPAGPGPVAVTTSEAG